MIRRSVFLILLLVQTHLCYSQSYLVIRPDGHKVQTREMCIGAGGKTIYTCDFDKTIIAWDAENGVPIRQYLGKIGPGNEGMVYSIALSPDEMWLAAGGWFGKDDETEDLGDIRIYEVSTGKMLFVLKGHKNIINDLAFTANGKQILAADADGFIRLWDLESKTIIREYFYKKEVDVKNIWVSGNYFVSGDQGGHLVLWDMNRSKPLKKDDFFEGYEIRDVCVSPDGKWIAASGERFISLYTSKLERVADIDNEEVASFLRFSPDSKKLLAGSTTSGQQHHCNVFVFENDVWDVYGSFDAHKSSVLAGGFLDEHTMVTAGGEDNEICIWSIRSKGEKAQLKRKMKGVGHPYYAASLKDKRIAFAKQWTANFGMSEITHTFDMLTRSISKNDVLQNWNRPVTKSGEYTLERKRTGGELEQLNSGLMILKNGVVVDSIIREYWNGSRHNVFGLTSAGWIVSGGSYGILSAYSLEGNEVSRFVGHEGDIWGLSLNEEGDRMITASSDQTIRIWELKNVGVPAATSNLISPLDYCRMMEVDATYKKVFDLLGLQTESKGTMAEDWKKVIAVLKKNNFPCQFLENKLAELTRNFIYPLVSVFLSENGEWIIWNEQGYYTASKKGARYVGYHINRGSDREAKYYPFEQFDLKFNRPDIILQDIGGIAPEVIEGYQLAYKKRLKKMGVNEEQLGMEIHLPELEITKYTVDGNKAKVSFVARDDKYDLQRLFLTVNDVPYYGRKGKSFVENGIENEIEFELVSGRNKIQLSVLNNKGAESYRETLLLFNAGTALPDLYLLSVGVSSYKDKKFNLRYAAKDATDVSVMMQKSKAFKKVNVLTLTDDKVNMEELKRAKAEFLAKAGVNDVVMLFVAGHGILDNDLNYYFAAHATDFNRPAEGGIAYEELESLLDGLKALRKILFMDTCHSGELEKDDHEITTSHSKPLADDVVFRNAGNVTVTNRKGYKLNDAAGLAREVFYDLRRGTGALVISSSGGAEYAMESAEWKNGLFTFCLLNGISEGTADQNKDGQITVGELQQVISERVFHLSQGAQQPTFRKENLEFDLRIW